MSSLAQNSNHLPERKLTYEEFLDAYPDTRAEWVNGKVILMPSPNLSHQSILGFLFRLLSDYVERHKLGQVLVAPFQMRLRAIPCGREPDVMFVSKSRLSDLTRMYLDGPADLAIEIVSPDSVQRDREEKFIEYQTAGVREYWLIDPDRKTAEFYDLGADRRYYPVPLCEGAYRSEVLPGFRLRIDRLWQDPLPPLDEVLRELDAAT
jgi:Uma2 family endonuclease